MYEGQQCKQCSIRFPNTEHGSQRMADHLDMHFRQNRKMEQHGRGHSRSWFVGAEVCLYIYPLLDPILTIVHSELRP